ncbi:MAG: hypothetical protein PHD55_04820 [Methanoregula sp.]|nr:hypothetical protein [Methanoregula sp.]
MTVGQEFVKGDEVRLKATFKDFSGTLVDPSAMTLKVYDSTGTAVITKTLSDLTREGLGVYHYDWVTSAIGDFIYEFSGTLADGATVIFDRFSVVYH